MKAILPYLYYCHKHCLLYMQGNISCGLFTAIQFKNWLSFVKELKKA